MTETELQSHQIDQKLTPKIDHAAPGILHVSRSGLLEDAFVNVVRDLVAQVLLHFRFDSIFIERVDLSGINAVPPEKLAMTLIKLPKRSICPLSINAKQRRQLQAVGERIVPCRPSRAVPGARRNAQIVERKIMLLIQADGCLRSIFFSVKQPEKLTVIFPIPSRIADMHEALVLDFSRNITQRWESVGRGRTFWPKLFFLWKPERTNPGENFKPWKKQPAHRGGQTPNPATGNEIKREISGDQNAERARFL